MTPIGDAKKSLGGVEFIGTVSFLILLVIFFGITLVGTASAQDPDDYVGAEACKPCHGKIYESWSGISHANERGCDECHTTGIYPDGKPVLKGVQCEACHLPGAEHVAKPTADNQLINWSADLCGKCHGESHHPQFADWKKSGHANSTLEDGGLASEDPKCKGCHVSQAVVSRFEGMEMGADAAPEPVDCQTCHDPHGSPYELQLRFPAEELCSKCHNTEGAEVGGKEFHPQSEMFSGSIMHEFGISCYDCHRFVKVYESDLYPRITGHSFEPRPEQCVNNDCHPGKDVDWAKNAVRVEQTEITAMLEEAEHEIDIVDSVLLKMYPGWDGTKSSVGGAPAAVLEAIDKYTLAEFNYEFVKQDRSNGVHNRQKAEHMLEEVEVLTEESMELIRQTTVGAGIAENGVDARGICGPTAVMLLAMVPALISRVRGRRWR